MTYVMNAEYFIQHIQCTRDGKQECLPTVRQLVELAFAAKEFGILKMDDLVSDHNRYPDPFLRKAVHLVVETSNQENIRDVLYNFIGSSKLVANHQFLNQVLIAETILAIGRSEDLEYIFNYLVPSLFGIEYESMVIEEYRNYKKERLRQGTTR